MMKAQSNSSCSVCLKPISKGDNLVWNRRVKGQSAHRVCYQSNSRRFTPHPGPFPTYGMGNGHVGTVFDILSTIELGKSGHRSLVGIQVQYIKAINEAIEKARAAASKELAEIGFKDPSQVEAILSGAKELENLVRVPA